MWDDISLVKHMRVHITNYSAPFLSSHVCLSR